MAPQCGNEENTQEEENFDKNKRTVDRNERERVGAWSGCDWGLGAEARQPAVEDQQHGTQPTALRTRRTDAGAYCSTIMKPNPFTPWTNR